MLELWQSERDELLGNKLYKISLKEYVICPRTNKKEETVIARLHIGQYSSLFIEGCGTANVYRM